jgi:dipeptidyl aminopeptidase/acylaminoacyl peptidase
MRIFHFGIGLSLLAVSVLPSWAALTPTLEQILGYPFVSGLVAASTGDRVAWVENVRGIRNIWFAPASGEQPHRLTNYTADDGQELTQLSFSPDGSHVLYVRGGDHDANWPAQDNLAPNPANSTHEAKVQIWSVAVTDPAPPVMLAEGDSPAISSKGKLAYIKKGEVWTTTENGSKPERLFFDRGKDDGLAWSPDGTRLAFVSNRDDHSFIGIYTENKQELTYLQPSTNFDSVPVWSPDGASLAFVREPGRGDEPQNFLEQVPHPFSIWVADTTNVRCHKVWSSPGTLAGSLPNLDENEPLFWMANGSLVFLAEMDDWPHLYAVDPKGGEAKLLTPGRFMVENLALAPDHQSIVYSANTGSTEEDSDRRHLFRVALDGKAPQPLTSGDSSQWDPAALNKGAVAYVTAGPQQPASVKLLSATRQERLLDTGSAKDYPKDALVVPKLVTFTAPDGLRIQGQLFRRADVQGPQAGVIFVHGGPPRQMLLGWHYRDYYSNAYAVNQYLASQGFTVLSVNYRLGIGYGRAFQHPPHAGPAGASEYQDVLAGARYLQRLPGVDPHAIGIWGGSYGGYLTGLALARNSDVFQAGVDFHGLGNWVPTLEKDHALPEHWWQATPEWRKAIDTAFAASPEANITTWRSPVLLIHGDDDRNVPFDQTVELAHRLEQQHTPIEELIIANDIHGFLRATNWLAADQSTVEFLTRYLRKDSANTGRHNSVPQK